MTESPDRPERFRVLFVCSGNTCRSPLAEAIALASIAERGWSHVDVASAGTFAGPGSPASAHSKTVARTHGLDLGSHRSRGVDTDLLHWADLVLTMSPGHLPPLVELGAAEKSSVLDAFALGGEGGGGVPDPFGGPLSQYEATYELLDGLVRAALDRLGSVIAP